MVLMVTPLHLLHLSLQGQQPGAQMCGQPTNSPRLISVNGLASPTVVNARRRVNEMRDFNLRFIVHTANNKGILSQGIRRVEQ